MQNLGTTHDSSARARRTRRIFVYTVATLVFLVISIGLLIGLRPLLLPFILGVFLAYLFKPLANRFRGSTFTKYARLMLFFGFLSAITYWSAALIKSSLPNEQEKLELKVRLQYRINERYKIWMGLTEGGTGNLIYKFFGEELDPLRKRIIDYVRLNDGERKKFLLYNNRGNSDRPESHRYYQYYLANLKSQKIDIEKIKAMAKDASPDLNNSVMTAQGEKASENHFASFLGSLSHWLIFPLAFIFILLDRGQIVHFFMSLIPNRYFELTHTMLENVDDALGKYIRGTMMECGLVGLTLIIGFYLCGVELKVAVLIGTIGGITNAIPFVGTFMACFIGAAYALIAENVHPWLPFINENNLMLAVIAVVLIAHLIDNAVYQPLVVGSAVNIHPLVVIMGVFGGSIMFGFAGLIFAIPTIVILKVVTQTLFTGLKDYRII